MNQDGWFCSFIPTEPGVYRFVFVVAADGTSLPDDVRVTIATELEPGPRNVRPAPPYDRAFLHQSTSSLPDNPSVPYQAAPRPDAPAPIDSKGWRSEWTSTRATATSSMKWLFVSTWCYPPTRHSAGFRTTPF